MNDFLVLGAVVLNVSAIVAGVILLPRLIRPAALAPSARTEDNSELEHLRAEIAQLKAELASKPANPEPSPADLEQIREKALRLVEREVAQTEKDLTAAAEDRAKRVLLNVMERVHVPYVVESTTSVVALPSEDVKGRIIGREGRNIRTFEQVAGVDLIIDDSPTTVVISCFDPVRRETARLTLLNLIVDGRIHPGRIEEVHAQSLRSMDQILKDAGREAAERAQVPGLAPRVLEAMGRLKFRAAMGQNALDHSVETSHLAALIAAELGCDVEVARKAGFLHDIGKGLGTEFPGPHALVGMELLLDCGVSRDVARAVGSHHREIEPESPEAQIVIVADGLSASRPGARRDSLDGHTRRLADIEKLAAEMPGVDKAFVVQGGREVRVLVRPDQLDDAGTRELARALAAKIEREMEYPGQIQVVVIRETRAVEVAQ